MNNEQCQKLRKYLQVRPTSYFWDLWSFQIFTRPLFQIKPHPLRWLAGKNRGYFSTRSMCNSTHSARRNFIHRIVVRITISIHNRDVRLWPIWASSCFGNIKFLPNTLQHFVTFHNGLLWFNLFGHSSITGLCLFQAVFRYGDGLFTPWCHIFLAWIYSFYSTVSLNHALCTFMSFVRLCTNFLQTSFKVVSMKVTAMMACLWFKRCHLHSVIWNWRKFYSLLSVVWCPFCGIDCKICQLMNKIIYRLYTIRPCWRKAWDLT